MAHDAELLSEIFSNQNPLAFDQKAVAELRAKHGVVPTWANRRWRSEMRGWNGLRPVSAKPDDLLHKAVVKCLKIELIDLEHQTSDGMIRQGDLVLCTMPAELYEKNLMKRHYRANRADLQLRKNQSEILTELKRIANPHFKAGEEDAQFQSEKGDLREIEGRKAMVTTKSLGGGGGRRGGK